MHNPVTILDGGRDLANIQDTKDMENTGNIADNLVNVRNFD